MSEIEERFLKQAADLARRAVRSLPIEECHEDCDPIGGVEVDTKAIAAALAQAREEGRRNVVATLRAFVDQVSGLHGEEAISFWGEVNDFCTGLEGSAAEQEFTERPPTKPGWYWARKKDSGEKRIMAVHEVPTWKGGTCLIAWKAGSDVEKNVDDHLWGRRLGDIDER